MGIRFYRVDESWAARGCGPLANWDTQRLAKIVRVGMDVRFTNGPTSVAMKR